ncbi:unnamed protein product [Cunninghamella blakesleeana]
MLHVNQRLNFNFKLCFRKKWLEKKFELKKKKSPRIEQSLHILILITFFDCFFSCETISRRERLRREKQAKENAAKKSTMKTYVHQTPFREAERNFKSRNPPPDFSEVYDIVINPNDERLEQVELSYNLRTLTFILD